MPLRSLFLTLSLLLVLVDRADAQESIRSGYERLYRGDVAGAVEYFRGLNSKEPQSPAAAFGVLMALYEQGLQEAPAQKEFEQRIDQLILMASTQYSKNKEDGEALFYLSQAYLHRGRYRVDFGKGMWGAARDGVAAKDYGDRYTKLHPDRADAYVTVGLYNYYVDIAPALMNVLRFLLFMPKGNRTEGLKQLERTARDGELFAPFAQNILIEIYGSYENRFDDGLRVAESLQKKYPDNPSYQFDLASLYANPEVEEYELAAQQYSSIIQHVDEKNPNYKAGQRYQAVQSLARMRQQQWRIDESIRLLTEVINSGVTQPEWVIPNFLMARSGYLALLNDMHAEDDPRRVLADPVWKRWHDTAQAQLKSIALRRQSGELATYAELIPANRMVVERHAAEAQKAYEAVRLQHPQDWQVRYRIADLNFARADYRQTEADLTPIVNASAAMPAWLKPNALLMLARIYDVRGQRDQAVATYKKIADGFKNQPAAQAARRGLIAPYHRRHPVI
jgi:tetratricopeptide (TPR) repeat protein